MKNPVCSQRLAVGGWQFAGGSDFIYHSPFAIYWFLTMKQ